MPQTGATRHQKFKKAEKSKTKLKAKKKDLPKGTNVTKIDFKLKKIIIREQLKKHDENEALSKRKLNIKELLSRLNHFNTNARLQALNGIKEIITGHPDTLHFELGQIIMGVIPLVTIIDKEVRRESLKLLHLILSNTNEESIYPFYDVMSTYLRSCITHIDIRIKEDSLLFFDLLLACCPGKVVAEFNKLFPNLMLLLENSTLYKILVEVEVEVSKWKVKVMQRVADFMIQYAKYNNLNKEKVNNINCKYIFNDSNNNSYPLFKPIYTSICQVSCFSAKNMNTVNDTVDNRLMLDYVSELIPKLFDVWKFQKETSSDHIETIITEYDASILKSILTTISILLDLMDDEWSIRECDRRKFTSTFFISFPYVTNVSGGQRRSSDAPVNKDPQLIEENLLLCEVYLKLSKSKSALHRDRCARLMLNYIEKIIGLTTSDSIAKSIDNFIENLIATVFWGTENIFTEFFDTLVTEYNETHSVTLKQRLFPLLCKLYDKEHRMKCIPAFKLWLKQLPDILLEESITKAIIDSLHKFAVVDKKLFDSLIKPKLINIIMNLPLIKVLDDHDSEYYYKLFSLLYWVKSWNDESLTLLEQQIIDSAYTDDHGKYIMNTIQLRAGGILEEFYKTE